MSDAPLPSTDLPTPAVPARPPVWVRLLPIYFLVLLLAVVFLFDRAHLWLEEDLGLGFIWALVAVLLTFLALAGVPTWAVLTYEHRRNRE